MLNHDSCKWFAVTAEPSSKQCSSHVLHPHISCIRYFRIVQYTDYSSRCIPQGFIYTKAILSCQLLGTLELFCNTRTLQSSFTYQGWGKVCALYVKLFFRIHHILMSLFFKIFHNCCLVQIYFQKFNFICLLIAQIKSFLLKAKSIKWHELMDYIDSIAYFCKVGKNWPILNLDFCA